ncbi:MAG: sulfatase-like hydrolase/transferase [Chloroflexaceae bacterium]|nr:sulfatase-like hydrolase/transferase [Chloroflexaceae bacterium]
MSLENLPKKPNIVLIITDQEREVMHWPEGWAEENLQARNRLIAHGLTFRNAQCNTAACSPSRASLMTGVYPAQHGVKNLIFCDDPKDKSKRRTPQLPTSLPNIATVLAEAGYHVVLKGKAHLSRPAEYNHEMKRTYWSEADVPHMAERYGFQEWNPPDMSDPMGLNDFGGGNINNDGRYVDGTGTAAGHYMPKDEQYRQSAINFINTYDGDKPFCLIVSLVNPHDVQAYPGRGIQGITSRKPIYEQGGYDLAEFKDLPIDVPPTVDEDLSTKPTVHRSVRQIVGVATGHLLNRTRQLEYVRFYAYLCREVDRQIGKVLDALDKKGLTDDTLIIRTSDHGELACSHGRMRQKFYNAYRETLSVPLIFSNPKLFPTPETTDAFASLIDLLPTLATIAHAPSREQYQFRGKDLTPILNGSVTSVQDTLHFTYEDDVFPVKGANCIRALIEQDWKYAVYYDPFKGAPTEYEMYDLKNDPLETTNLAHPTHFKAEYAAQRTRLHNRLIEVMLENGTLPEETAWPTADDFKPVSRSSPAETGLSENVPVNDLLPRGIKIRRWIYTIVLILMSLDALYQVTFAGADIVSTLVGLIAGGLLGTYVFSHLTKLSWDDDEGRIVSKMDLGGVLTLVGYITFVVVRDTLLDRRFDGPTLDAVSASVVSGVMIGQLYSLRTNIRRILGLDNETHNLRRYEHHIDIDAPVETVWAVFTDFARFGEWNPLLTQVEVDDGGELAIDTSLTLRATGIPGTVKATVTKVEPPFALGWVDHLPLKLLTPRFGIVLLPLEGERTRFIVKETFEGPLLPVVGWRLDSQMPPLYEAMGKALAQEVEKNKITA